MVYLIFNTSINQLSLPHLNKMCLCLPLLLFSGWRIFFAGSVLGGATYNWMRAVFDEKKLLSCLPSQQGRLAYVMIEIFRNDPKLHASQLYWHVRYEIASTFCT